MIFAIGNIGYLLGALLDEPDLAPDRRRAGDRRRRCLAGIALLLIPLAPQDERAAIPFLVVAGLIVGFGVVLYNVTQLSMRQAITPERLQGRMNSSIRFIVWGIMPLGLLVGGALATTFDLRTAIWVGAIGNSLSWLPLVIGPVIAPRGPGDRAGAAARRVRDAGALPGPAAPRRAVDARLADRRSLAARRTSSGSGARRRSAQFGSQITLLALPLTAIVTLDATPFEVALLGALEYLPFLLVTLPAGVWVDRLRRRPLLIAATSAGRSCWRPCRSRGRSTR